jgi:fatty-acyl-CoA synthase
MLTHRNIVNNAYWLGEGLALTPQDRLCVPVPFFHCFGCVIGVLGAYTHASALVPLESFDPLRVLQYVERERCTALYGVPTMFIAELEHLDYHSFDRSSLRTGIMAGALCPEPLMRKVMDRMNLTEMTIAYGLTEASPGITLTPRDDSIELRTQTVGRALPEVEVKIVDPATGEECPPNSPGELCCRGYNVMKGYYNNPKATADAISADGWLRTGDQATIDERGYVRITGRIKEIIIRGGENIAPKEIEDLLRRHPKISDAYVYGVPDEKYGEEVAAAIRLKQAGSATTEEIREFCLDKIARFKIPRHIRFVESFPMTASGKVQKFKLREMHIKGE